MAEYINKEQFLASMGLTGDETKYGNRDAEHLHRSYSTYMSYEIMDSVDDCIVEEELVPVVHGRWEVVHGVLTPGGDPLLRCPICKARESEHLCGVECRTVWNYCPNCGARMDGDSDEG